MLEVVYDVATKEVRAWNADDSVQGNLKPKEAKGLTGAMICSILIGR